MASFVPYVADNGRWLDHFERLAKNPGKRNTSFYLTKPVQTGKGDSASPVVNVSPTEAEVARAKSDVAMGLDIKDDISDIAQLAQKLQSINTTTALKKRKKVQRKKSKPVKRKKNGF